MTPHSPRPMPLDFAQAYRDIMQDLGFSEKTPVQWDAKADSFNRRLHQYCAYSGAFLARVHTLPQDTVLDVGCGPGGLALPLAAKVAQVYGLDYSPKMLAYLAENAREAGLDNIRALALSKEDDWQGRVPVCDVVIASRSGLDRDLAALLSKLSRHARRRVYFSCLVGGRFLPPQIDAVLGITRPPFPDYIYAVNILYQLGYDAEVSFIPTPGRLADCRAWDDFRTRMREGYGELDAASIGKLRAFFAAEQPRFGGEAYAMKWALLSWAV